VAGGSRAAACARCALASAALVPHGAGLALDVCAECESAPEVPQGEPQLCSFGSHGCPILETYSRHRLSASPLELGHLFVYRISLIAFYPLPLPSPPPAPRLGCAGVPSKDRAEKSQLTS
jgi:hypothetical protein